MAVRHFFLGGGVEGRQFSLGSAYFDPFDLDNLYEQVFVLCRYNKGGFVWPVDRMSSRMRSEMVRLLNEAVDLEAREAKKRRST